ncbi:hypothetical protein ABZP36_010275 [Zizania latifolia]
MSFTWLDTSEKIEKDVALTKAHILESMLYHLKCNPVIHHELLQQNHTVILERMLCLCHTVYVLHMVVAVAISSLSPHPSNRIHDTMRTALQFAPGVTFHHNSQASTFQPPPISPFSNLSPFWS